MFVMVRGYQLVKKDVATEHVLGAGIQARDLSVADKDTKSVLPIDTLRPTC